MTANTQAQPLPHATILLIALLQGFSLLALHSVVELKPLLFQSAPWILMAYVLTLSIPILLMLGLTENKPQFYSWVLSYGLVLALLTYYQAIQIAPWDGANYGFLIPAIFLSISVASFKVLMYAQHFMISPKLSYNTLFTLSWRNVITLGLSLLLTLMVWALLILWGQLFETIGIEQFSNLFEKKAFLYPVLALANGIGICLFRQQTAVIDSITRLKQTLMKLLLVVIVFIFIIFLGALPFTGLSPLWESGGSTLILWVQALVLFLVNAVYQDKPSNLPYPLWLHRLIYFGLSLLPIYSAISFYGLSLRVDQYGWSVARCWGFLLWTLLFAFSLGYLWGIVKRKDQWLHHLSWINLRMGLVVLVAMLLVNSPLLDFRKISLNSQLTRLQSGEINLKELDFTYLAENLGKPGYRALQKIKSENKDTRPEIALLITNLYTSTAIGELPKQREDLKTYIESLSSTLTKPAPKTLINDIYHDLLGNGYRLKRTLSYHLIDIDLNEDGELEYVLLEEQAVTFHAMLYYYEENTWQSHRLENTGFGKEHAQQIIDAIKTGNYRATRAPWNQLKIGNHTFKVF